MTDERARLEALRAALRAESLSWSDLAELQALAPHIDLADVELAEAAGIPENAVRVDMVSLDGAVDFDRPFRVLDERTIDFPDDVHEAECYIDVDADGYIVEGGEADLIESLRRQGWEPVDGYSGQQGYSGPIMHASEYLGGGMARDVLQTPGTYVVQAVECTGFGDEGANVQPGDAAYSDEPAGWILLRRRDGLEAGR